MNAILEIASSVATLVVDAVVGMVTSFLGSVGEYFTKTKDVVVDAADGEYGTTGYAAMVAVVALTCYFGLLPTLTVWFQFSLGYATVMFFVNIYALGWNIGAELAKAQIAAKRMFA